MMDELEIYEDDGRFSIYGDVASLLWPNDDYEHDNHQAQELIQERMCERGCNVVGRADFTPQWRTPHGLVSFDSEADGMSFDSTSRDAVEWLVLLIRELVAERDELRARLV